MRGPHMRGPHMRGPHMRGPHMRGPMDFLSNAFVLESFF